MKRALDIVASSFGLVVLTLVGPFIALAIRLESHGPAIFRQERVGQYGEVFTLYKFRSMAQNTHVLPTHLVSAQSLTRVGAFLRRTKLDELPQLWNVLRGEMSLVGPRPGLPSQAELTEQRMQQRVLELRPGITGPAQVAGVDMSDPILLASVDAGYHETQSLLFDLRCILATVSGGGSGDRVNADSETDTGQ